MRDALRIASPAARVVRVWPRRVRLALAASLCVLVGLIHAAYLPALLSVFARDRFDDFDLFYRSVRAVVDGGTLQWLAKSTGELNVNAPVFHLAVLPFAFVGAVPAAVLWAVAMLVAGGASLALVLGVLGVRPGVEGWLWLLLSLTLFPGPYAVVVSGGLAFSLMLPMTLAWSSARREQWVAAGAWLGVLVALKLFTAIFVVYLVVRRKWRGVLAMLGTAGGLALAGGWVFGWSAYVRWFQALAQVNWESGLLNGSLRGAVARAVLAGALPQPGAALAWTAAAGVVATGTAIVLVRHRRDVDFAFAILLVAALLLSPLGWVHYLLLAAGPLAGRFGGALATGSRRVTAGACAVVAGMVLCVPYTALVGPLSRGPFRVVTLSLSTWGLVLVWTTLMLCDVRDQREGGAR